MATPKRDASKVSSRLKQQVESHAELQRRRIETSKAVINTRWQAPALDLRNAQNRKRQRQVSEKEKANRTMQARLDAIYQRQKPHYHQDYDAGVLHARTHLHDLRSKVRAKQQSSVAQKNQLYKQRLAAVKAYYTSAGVHQKAANKEKPVVELSARRQSADNLDFVFDYMLEAPRATSTKVANVPNPESMLHMSNQQYLVSPFVGSGCMIPSVSSTRSNRQSGSNRSRPRSAPALGRTATNRLQLPLMPNSGLGDQPHTQSSSAASSPRDKVLLASRTVPMLGEEKNCVLHIYARPGDYESLYVEVYSSSQAKTLLGERTLSIDDTFSIVDEHQQHNMAENSQCTTMMLMNIFTAADIDNNGKLTYREFRRLMQQANLGLSDPELQLLLSEAEESSSGMIVYSEFVPLAVDMINAFRARSRARRRQRRAESVVDDQVLSLLSSEELNWVYSVVFPMCQEHDRDDSGIITIAELKEILKSSRVGLTPVEVNVMMQSIRRDSFGNVTYKTDVFDTLKQVKFTLLKNAILESQSSDIEQHLLKACQAEERRSLHDSTSSDLPGWITIPALLNVLLTSTRLPLNRLQALVVLREAESVDGLVDYQAFVPVAAKAIEVMFSPSTLKQRADLIADADLSVETMLKGKSSPAFQKRLKVLFRSYDVDHNGELDFFEFRSCLLSLDLGLSDIEIEALMASADRDGNGTVNLEEFAHFCANKLVELEREKHIRTLHATIVHAAAQREAMKIEPGNKLGQKLKLLLLAADHNGSGTLTVTEMADVFAALSVILNPFELTVLMSEIDENDDGVVNYEEFIPVCADLLQVYQQQSTGDVSPAQGRNAIDKQVEALVRAEQTEIERVVGRLLRMLQGADFTKSGKLPRRDLAALLRRPLAMVSRSEANHILAAMSSPTSSKDNLIKYQGLLPYYLEARRTTFKRNLLARSELPRFEQQFLDECDVIIQAKHEPQSPMNLKGRRTLSMQEIFQVLRSGIGAFRLSHAQILALLASFDCRNCTEGEIDCHNFAQHAVDMVETFYDPEHIERLSAVVAHAQLKADEVLSGVGERAIYDHCVRAFTGLAGHSSLANHCVVTDVLSTIPRIKLSRQEIRVLVATAPAQDDQIVWPEFVEQLYQTICQLLRDRKLHRRLIVSLAELSRSAADLEPLKQVAEDLATLLEVTRVKSAVQVILPSKDKSMVEHAEKPADSATDNDSRFDGASSKRRLALPRARSAIKLMPESLGEFEKREISCVGTHGKLVLVKGTELQVPMVIQVHMTGDQTEQELQLELRAVSVDGSIEVRDGTPIPLPSICVVDQETARQYVRNMIDHLMLVCTENGRFYFEVSHL